MSALHLPLKLHPDSQCDAVEKIEVIAGRTGRNLAIWYMVTGELGEIRMPTGPMGPGSELWKHTCFEAFIRPTNGTAYVECNFAPSQWAGYEFDEYRSGMKPFDLGRPLCLSEVSESQYNLRADVNFPRLIAVEDWRLGLSAVIEETNGNKSYWALAHPPGKPDFHHEDCFAAELPAAGKS